MHPDIQLIVRLWSLDSEVDQARERAASLKSVVTDLEAHIEELSAQLETTADEVSETESREAAIQVELDKYLMRTKRTAKLLDGHQAVDFVTVEKQLEQCKAHVDRLEGDLLAEMEGREVLQTHTETLESDRAQAREHKESAHTEWVSEGRQIRTQIEAVWPTRQAAAAELNRELEKRYTGFRERKLAPVSELRGKVCSSCHVVVQDQMRLEVSSGRRVHTCRGCSRWLLPEPEQEDTELAPDGAGE